MPLRQTHLSFRRRPLQEIPANPGPVKRKRKQDDEPLAPAAPPTIRQFQRRSREMVAGAIRGWIGALGEGHRFIGVLGGVEGNEMVMPLAAADGRKLTWEKFAGEVSLPLSPWTSSRPTSADCGQGVCTNVAAERGRLLVRGGVGWGYCGLPAEEARGPWWCQQVANPPDPLLSLPPAPRRE